METIELMAIETLEPKNTHPPAIHPQKDHFITLINNLNHKEKSQVLNPKDNPRLNPPVKTPPHLICFLFESTLKESEREGGGGEGGGWSLVSSYL